MKLATILLSFIFLASCSSTSIDNTDTNGNNDNTGDGDTFADIKKQQFQGLVNGELRFFDFGAFEVSNEITSIYLFSSPTNSTCDELNYLTLNISHLPSIDTMVQDRSGSVSILQTDNVFTSNGPTTALNSVYPEELLFDLASLVDFQYEVISNTGIVGAIRVHLREGGTWEGSFDVQMGPSADSLFTKVTQDVERICQ